MVDDSNTTKPRPAEDEAMGRLFKEELDAHLFDGLALDNDKKKEWMDMIQQTETVQVRTNWWTSGRKRLVSGAVAAALMLGIGIPLFLSNNPIPLPGTEITVPGTQPPDPGTSGGIVDPGSSELSPLVTEQVGSLEEAEEKFGEPIRLPEAMPEGYELVEIAAVGYPGESPLRVHFQYESGEDGYLTFSVDKQDAVYPGDLFSAIDLGDAEGMIYAQPTLTELFWKVGDIQYSIVGTINEAQATALASSTLA
ncbi:hypothetical protein [Paenibacillus sp. 1P07SE]|uniref:hypothetical protein n=1 Tax=Paenibacillus sp. 1P07SE TaxID=3132209 RepID=UPI0039A46787